MLLNHCLHHEVVEMLNTIMEEKDSYTAGHSKRVALYSSKIAHALGLDKEMQKVVYTSGLLHDIGKIVTPESILLKPKKLTKKEYAVIQRHATDSERILESIGNFRPYLSYIRHHHEFYNGQGYPDKLQGETIPLVSRILCVADAFDAMTTNRIYKPRKTNLEAIEELKKYAGEQFDPYIVDVANEFFKDNQELIDIHQNPQSEMQEARFAFYYKDKVSTAYSSEYLTYFLTQNKHIKTKFQCCYFIELHHVHQFNQEFGWKAGNSLLKKVVLRLKLLFDEALIFRIFGDDFILLSHHHINLDSDEIKEKLTLGFSPVKSTITYFSLDDFTFKSWEDFEPYLKMYKKKQKQKEVIKL